MSNCEFDYLIALNAIRQELTIDISDQYEDFNHIISLNALSIDSDETTLEDEYENENKWDCLSTLSKEFITLLIEQPEDFKTFFTLKGKVKKSTKPMLFKWLSKVTDKKTAKNVFSEITEFVNGKFKIPNDHKIKVHQKYKTFELCKEVK